MKIFQAFAGKTWRWNHSWQHISQWFPVLVLLPEDFQDGFFAIGVHPDGHLARFGVLEHKMVEGLYPIEGVPPEDGVKKSCPVILIHQYSPVLLPNKLRLVD